MTLLRSVVITILVSLGFAFGLKNLLGFWETFSLAIVIQFIVGFIYNSKKINKVQVLTTDFQNELEQLLSLSEAKIPCPCGNYTYTTNLFYNIEETYVCEECGNEFRIEFSATPTLLTQPVYTEQDFNNLKEEKVEGVEITSDYKPGTEL
jgi:hypothetical protein|tara:strand:+ start:107 stop:556 length:450 start_codon:yes stop_codon:yes gene_type:complete